jgi:MFS family permease
MARPRFTGLWRNPDFLKLWAGETVSLFGSLIGGPALAFTAILVLDASPLHMGLLTAAGTAPGLLGGLVAGVWVDRLRRRPVLIGADLGRALLLGTIPLAAVFDLLCIEHLYVVAFLTGLLTLTFDVAYLAYLPSLLRRDQLVEGNSKLAASAAVAEASGFGISGWLIQALSAPLAVLVDALSFVVSAIAIRLIRASEPPPPARAERPGFLAEMNDGLHTLAGSAHLRALTASIATLEFAGGLFGAVVLLYTTRTLGLPPGIQGLIFAVGGVTSLLGALAAGGVIRRLGVGPAMILGLLLTGTGSLLIPLAPDRSAASLLLLVGSQLVSDPARTLYMIAQVSLRQALTPAGRLGRVNAGTHMLTLSAALLGALGGGLLAEGVGLRSTLVIGACGSAAAALWLVVSPLRSLRTAPEG